MAFEVEPFSKRWREIVAEKDENKKGRMLCRYVYELERQVEAIRSETYELDRLRKENRELKESILSLDIVRQAMREAVSEACRECNTDWIGMQGGS